MTANGTATKRVTKKKIEVAVTKESILNYLSDRHCILWGQVNNISRQEGKDKAADWLLTIIQEIKEYGA